MEKIVILILLIGQSLIAQIKIGTYTVISDSLKPSPKLSLQKDNKFKYDDETSFSCYAWYHTKGTWKINFDKLILVDSVFIFNKDVTKRKYINRKTIYNIDKNNLIFYNQLYDKNEFEYEEPKQLRKNFVFRYE